MLISKLFLKKIRRIYFLSNLQYKNACTAFLEKWKSISTVFVVRRCSWAQKIWPRRRSSHDAFALIFCDLKDTMIISWNVNKCWNFDVLVLYLYRYSSQIQWYGWNEHIQIDFGTFYFVNWVSIPEMKWVALNWKIQQKWGPSVIFVATASELASAS